jgi:diguanylate cyclase (GGDEF)-like protein
MIAMMGVSGLACMMGVLAPMTENAPVELKAAFTAVCAAVAAILWRAGSDLPKACFHGCLVLAVSGMTAIISVAHTPQGAVSASLGYLWVALYAAVFFGRTAARVYAVLVGLAYGAALLVNPFEGALHIWALVMVTVAVGAEAVAVMVARLATLAETDQLTGLWNRAGLQRAAARALAEAARRGTPLTLTVIDLDGFKLVNDRDGHAAGDRLLVELATAWQGCLRTSDVLARLGGDEFVLLLPRSGAGETEAALSRLRAASTSHWSAGTAGAEPSDDLDALLARADRRLYLDKARRPRTRGLTSGRPQACTVDAGRRSGVAEQAQRDPVEDVVLARQHLGHP